MVDRSFRFVACFTVVYGVFALAMIVGQPRSPTSTALVEAGSDLQAPASQPAFYRFALASAE
jgi:hypothetical protein